MIKKIMVILTLFLSFISTQAENLTLENALNLYLKNNINSKTGKIDADILSIRKSRIVQQAYNNLGVSANSTLAVNPGSLSGQLKLTYNNDYYLSLSPKVDFPTGKTTAKANLALGYSSSINSWFYNQSAVDLKNNEIDSMILKQQLVSLIQGDIETLIQKYLNIKTLSLTLSLDSEMLSQKRRDLEIAGIKLKNGNIGQADFDVISSNIAGLEAQYALASLQYDEALGELKLLLGNNNITVSPDEIAEPDSYEIYVGTAEIEQIKLQITKEENTLKELRYKNQPQGKTDINYDITDNKLSAGITFSMNPFDFAGSEKEQEQKIEKLKLKLADEQNKTLISKLSKENEIKKAEMNILIAKEELAAISSEAAKYGLLYSKGASSEYDYFSKQLDKKNKDAAYRKAVNTFAALKIKYKILGDL